MGDAARERFTCSLAARWRAGKDAVLAARAAGLRNLQSLRAAPPAPVAALRLKNDVITLSQPHPVGEPQWHLAVG